MFDISRIKIYTVQGTHLNQIVLHCQPDAESTKYTCHPEL